ncbi:hypothetical protein BDR05DRAFT_1030553 [Suillus weaverae]|nr:hypothetical protein BDR05DRAFT_1030553 [Suillus weaverae]
MIFTSLTTMIIFVAAMAGVAIAFGDLVISSPLSLPCTPNTKGCSEGINFWNNDSDFAYICGPHGTVIAYEAYDPCGVTADDQERRVGVFRFQVGARYVLPPLRKQLERACDKIKIDVVAEDGVQCWRTRGVILYLHRAIRNSDARRNNMRALARIVIPSTFPIMDTRFLDTVMSAEEGVGKADEFTGTLWRQWKEHGVIKAWLSNCSLQSLVILYGFSLAYLVAPDTAHIVEFVAGLPDYVNYTGKVILAAPFTFHFWNGL